MKHALILIACLFGGALAFAGSIPTVTSHAGPAIAAEMNAAIAEIQAKVTTGVVAQTAAVSGTVTPQTASITVTIVPQTVVITDKTDLVVTVWTNATASFTGLTNVTVSVSGVTTNVTNQRY